MKKHLLILSAIIIFTTVFTSCTNNDNEKNSRISIRLVDNPGDFDKVYVDVQDVLVKKEGEGWESIGNVDAQIYDLLTLTGGIDALLVDSEIPSGMLNQIRLVLGDQNSIVIDGITFPLNTPSAQQSGLKLSVNTELVAGVAYNFILDFDVDRSIAIVAGNSANINLHPVIRVITEAESGAISGDVSPFDYQVLVSAVSGTETISAYTDSEGNFILHGVPQGTYTVTFTPDVDSGLNAMDVDNVEVILGENNNLGTVHLN